MKITYNPQADALYLSFRDGEVARTQEAGEGIQLDYDEAGRIIGIEILRDLATWQVGDGS